MDILAMTVYLAVTGFTPGPNNLMSLYLGAHYGLSGARKFIIASVTGFFIKALLCGALNVALASAVPKLVPYLKWLGAAYMLYLAWHMLRDGFAAKGEEKEKSGESTYASGFALQVVNVKSWVCSLSVFSVYVIPYTTSALAIVLVSTLSTTIMAVATVLWATCGSAFRRVYQEHRKVFSVVLAASLVFCAVTALQ